MLVAGRVLCGDAGGINHGCLCCSWAFLDSKGFILLSMHRDAKRKCSENHDAGNCTVLCVSEE